MSGGAQLVPRRSVSGFLKVGCLEEAIEHSVVSGPQLSLVPPRQKKSGRVAMVLRALHTVLRILEIELRAKAALSLSKQFEINPN